MKTLRPLLLAVAAMLCAAGCSSVPAPSRGFAPTADPPGPVRCFPSPAIEPGEGLVNGDPPAIEAAADCFIVRFRTKKAGVTYKLLSSEKLSRDDADWTFVEGEKATWTSSEAKVGADPDGELVALEAPIPEDQTVQFYRVRASW